MFDFVRKYFVGYIQEGFNDLKEVVISLGDDAIRHEEDQNQKIVNMGRRIKALNNKVNDLFKETDKALSRIRINYKEMELLKMALTRPVVSDLSEDKQKKIISTGTVKPV